MNFKWPRIITALFSLWLFGAPACAAEELWKAGTARANITPTEALSGPQQLRFSSTH